MRDQVDKIRQRFEVEVQTAHTSKEIEDIKVAYLGKKGPIQALMKELRNVDEGLRPQVGRWINDLKDDLVRVCEERLAAVRQEELRSRLEQEWVDVTLPGRRRHVGGQHIVNQVLVEVVDILVEMGFSIQDGPEVETEYYNFEALNFPPDHPARDMQDTFYINEDFLLRTQTSNIQARVMESTQPPIRIICPGRVYRNETVTARSHVFFHQVEGFYVDKGVSFANLLATIEEFLQKLLGQDTKIRYRPSYFPFVEPGLEVDVSCSLCRGEGCSMCKGTGWVEVLGAGMVHPAVLQNGGIDPEIYSGYAWGMGVERLINLRYGVNDIRLFTQNDLRFLRQFSSISSR